MSTTQETDDGQLDREVVEAVLESVPDRELVSQTDVALLYAAASQYRDLSGHIPDSVVSEMVTLFDTKDELLGEPNSIVAVNLDLTGDEPQLGDPPVTFDTYSEETRFKLGFVKKSNATTGIHHSVTMWSNETSIEDIGGEDHFSRFVDGRFKKWPNFSEVDTLIRESDEGYILSAIAALGNDDEFIERACDAVIEQSPVDEFTGMVTLRVKTDEETGYRYPGEIPVLSQAAKERQLEKYTEDGISIDTGLQGEGAGYVTGEKTSVLGGTAGINSQYAKKKVDIYQNLSEGSAWKIRPLDEDYASALDTADDAIENFYEVVSGVRLYHLPYPAHTVVDYETFCEFYTNVYEPLVTAAETDAQDEDASLYITRLVETLIGEEIVSLHSPEGTTPAESTSQSGNGGNAPDTDYDALIGGGEGAEDEEMEMRLYTIVHNSASDPSRTLSETGNASFTVVSELAQAYAAIRENLLATHWREDMFGLYCFPQTDSTSIAESVFSGYLFRNTTSNSPDPDSGDSAENLDHPAVSRYASLLQGDPLSHTDLLKQYVNRLRLQQRKAAAGEGLDESPFVVAQFEQLQALEAANMLDTEFIGATNAMNNTTTDADMDRDEQLTQMLESHDLLDEQNPAQRAAFLLGGLVGRISSLQRVNNVSQPVSQKYTIGSLTSRSFEQIMSEVLDKNEEYIEAGEYTTEKYNRRYVSALRDTILANPPDTWDVRRERLQWVYAFGISYGKEDTASEE